MLLFLCFKNTVINSYQNRKNYEIYGFYKYAILKLKINDDLAWNESDGRCGDEALYKRKGIFVR